MESGRLPRFLRNPGIGPIVLTSRDRKIIRCVLGYRFLRSTHLRSFVPGSGQNILRRLQMLFHHGYLDRPRTQIDYYRQGSKAMVYGLGNKGKELLEREDGIPHRKLDWTANNRSVTRFFMEHTLAVADAMVALELSSRRRHVEMVHHQSVPAEGLKWSVPVHHLGVTAPVGLVPDRVFGLKTQTGTRWFFLEADRATMPIERNNLKQTSFYRKLLAYHETWRQKTIKDSFPRFQVLTVTTTPERVQNLLEATRRLTKGKGAGLFLFVDHQAFTAAEDVLQLPLLNGRGEEVTLRG
jgi:hypothetical protein